MPIPPAFRSGAPRRLSSGEVHSLRAEAALAVEQTTDAEAELSAALAEDPGNVAALRRRWPSSLRRNGWCWRGRPPRPIRKTHWPG